jgi:putative radical SAM enzyme (TIGR03279 family)
MFEHRIKEIISGSIAEELELEPGDAVLAVNGQEIEDVFDYHYLTNEEELTVLVRKADGEEWELEIEKEFEEDLGIVFESSLMDEYRSCRNKCIFCFIDQMPPGMRDTLYFKDDDSRLSFLQGNYVTLTNMSDHDIDRIIRYHLEPINISFHTMNPQLRCRMLNNRFAGDIFPKVQRLAEAGIEMNGQIVLCKGVNDGAELEYSIEQLTQYLPYLKSVSVVPVGLTRFRDGLYPLEPFTPEDAGVVIDSIEACQRKIYAEHGLHFIHASDEWYIMADRPFPEEKRYDGYLQLENGVGMMRLLAQEVRETLAQAAQDDGETSQEAACRKSDTDRETAAAKASSGSKAAAQNGIREISLATGRLAAPYLEQLYEEIRAQYPQVKLHIYAIRNDFFGERITVSGLITGTDLVAQLKGRQLGSELLLPVNMLRSGEEVFLDDMTVQELENALQIKVRIVKSSGYDFVCAVTGVTGEDCEETEQF